MPSEDLPPYRPARNPMREVEILTSGEFLLMGEGAADRLEALLDRARSDPAYMPDIHRFSLCFESASGSCFTMPGRYWVDEFKKRIGPVLKACDITLVEGTHGALSQWDREIWKPRQDVIKRGKKARKDG